MSQVGRQWIKNHLDQSSQDIILTKHQDLDELTVIIRESGQQQHFRFLMLAGMAMVVIVALVALGVVVMRRRHSAVHIVQPKGV